MKVKAKGRQQSRMDLLALTNERHCSSTPIYGSDLINSMKINVSTKSSTSFTAALGHQFSRKDMGTCLCNIIKLPKHRVKERKGITSRYSNSFVLDFYLYFSTSFFQRNIFISFLKCWLSTSLILDYLVIEKNIELILFSIVENVDIRYT